MHDMSVGAQPHPEEDRAHECDDLKKGLGRALDLLRQARCKSCSGSLGTEPKRGTCTDPNHAITAFKIMELEQLL
jgi:hypothetical protein